MKQYTKEEIGELNPHDLLELALEDLERVERDLNYTIDMSVWHKPYTDKYRKTCHVCLAGSVLTRFFKPDESYAEHMIKIGNIPSWVIALERFRSGKIQGGLGIMGYCVDDFKDIRITYYCMYPQEFKEDMRKILKMFKENPPVKKEV